jgi:hypothetical protein
MWKQIAGFILCAVSLCAQGYNFGKPNWVLPSTQFWTPEASSTPTAAQLGFTFTLTSNITTSAGVYTPDGTMVRTLWRGRFYKAGTYTHVWDGKDDFGVAQTAGTYNIRVLANNLKYDWDGTIGNTEDKWVSTTNLDALGYNVVVQMLFAQGKGYIVPGYIEGAGLSYVFDKAKPNTVQLVNPYLYSSSGTGTTVGCGATDGNMLYYCIQANLNPSYIVKMYPGGQPGGFSAGTLFTTYWGQSDKSVYLPLMGGDVTGTPGVNTTSQPTGIAVERTGNILAVSHGSFVNGTTYASQDSIHLLDKVTGASLGSIAITNPQALAFSPTNDLWVIGGTVSTALDMSSALVLSRVQDIGGANTITQPISGLVRPLSVAVDPSNGHIFVADGGTSQQIKEYDTTLSLVHTYGDLGGYTTANPNGCDALVTKTKLFLDGYNKTAVQSFSNYGGGTVSVDDVGNLWISDVANQRVLHIRPDGTYINQVMYQPAVYQTTANHSDPTRVFGYIREYKVDYTKPLLEGDPDPALGGNGSWALYKNWGACGQTTLPVLHDVETLPNGRVYAVGFTGGFGGGQQFVELPATGGLRFSANAYPFTAYRSLMPNGDAPYLTATAGSGIFNYTIGKYPLTGYDVNVFPTYPATPTTIATFSQHDTLGGPRTSRVNGWAPDITLTTGGILPIYQNQKNITTAVGRSYHVGGIRPGGTALLFRAMPGDYIYYPDGIGTFTENESFGGHNGIEHHVLDNTFVTQYDGQTAPYDNQYVQWSEDGLFVGQFGHRGSQSASTYSYAQTVPEPGDAENLQSFTAVKVGTDWYIYHGDEAVHKGIHRWHIYGWSTMHEYGASGTLGNTIALTTMF